MNTKASMKEDDVVKMFINAVKEDGFYDAEFIINGCFNVEFGYYDLNASISFTDAKYVKAWKITSSFTEEVVAYINDEKSELIYYFNGIYID